MKRDNNIIVNALSIEDIDKSIEDAKVILRKLENMRNVILGGSEFDINIISKEKEVEFEELLVHSNSGKKKLLSKSRIGNISLERHIVCWLAKYELGIHEKSIAFLLGRDRTTILNSLSAVNAMIEFPFTVPNYCEKLFNRVLKFKEKQNIDILTCSHFEFSEFNSSDIKYPKKVGGYNANGISF